MIDIASNMASMRQCDYPDCGRKHVAHGHCAGHRAQLARGQKLRPLHPRLITNNLATRLRTYAPEGALNECWEWTLARNKGYGVISTHGSRIRGAHTVAWELANNQKLPPGMVIRHSCDNPPCTNPAHLLLGTHADNVADRVRRGRQLSGEQMTHSKLTEFNARAIRALYARGGVYQWELAKMFGVSQSNISLIILGKAWLGATH